MKPDEKGKILYLPLPQKISSINTNKEILTIEKLRTFKGLENLPDAEANQIIFSLHALSSILYEIYMEMSSDGIIIDNQRVNSIIDKKSA